MTTTPSNASVANASLAEQARMALAFLDLTSLNDQDTEADIARLCARAQGPHGPVAAVCVWPRLAAFARQQLPAHISVAAVANFPHGNTDVRSAVADTQAIVQSGAQEVDVVIPYRALIAGAHDEAVALLQAVRKASEGLLLKVILETGELQDMARIALASRISLDAGADFLKTSTGKTPVSATPAAAQVLLQAIAADPQTRDRVGFKPSGGIRTVADAAVYMQLTEQTLGSAALTARRFRIGASGILSDIEAILGNVPAPALPPQGNY